MEATIITDMILMLWPISKNVRLTIFTGRTQPIEKKDIEALTHVEMYSEVTKLRNEIAIFHYADKEDVNKKRVKCMLSIIDSALRALDYAQKERALG